MKSLRLFAPAKINLFLAITGRRPDGFHELLSVGVPVCFGDELVIQERADSAYSLDCDDPSVPIDDTNLVLRAARLFAETVGENRGAHFQLKKRVPIGAGLGGGSSDGTAALLGLNQQRASPLDDKTLARLAAKLGSDCALFLHQVPCLMRGRGEQITPLPEAAAARLLGRRVFIFKPSFGISTAWAYGEMAKRGPVSYVPAPAAEERLSRWIDSTAPAEELLFNNMEPVAFSKFIALPTLLEQLRQRFGLAVGMSGSGSACYALLAEKMDADPLIGQIQDAWGKDVFVVETRIGKTLLTR